MRRDVVSPDVVMNAAQRMLAAIKEEAHPLARMRFDRINTS
ncbi:hypothetical protein [Paraburkholderia franconis]|nr:hypothetical protein [Paraburkholderia franconis]